MHPPPTISPCRRHGSALITVILFTFVLGVLVAVLVSWTISDRRFNVRTVYWNEARNAAEGLCEYGGAQMIYAMSNYDVPPTTNPGIAISNPVTNLPLQLPLLSNGHSFLNPNEANGITLESHVDSKPFETFSGTVASLNDKYGLDLIAGPGVPVTSNGRFDYIDPGVPENATDPFVGLNVLRTDYTVLATATAVPPDGSQPISSHVQQIVSARGAPLFDFFIFYAINDLEIYPGSNMTVTGPVHSNSDMYLNASGGATLTFNGTVTATGNIFHAMENSTDGQTAMSNDNIYFQQVIPPAAPTTFSMYDGSQWNDSTMGADANLTGPDTPPGPGGVPAGSALNNTMTPSVVKSFQTYAKQHWPGTVLTAAMNVQTFNPTGFNSFLTGGKDHAGNLYLPDSLYVDSGDQVTVPNGIPSPYIDHHVANLSGTKAQGNVSYINDPPDCDFNINATTGTYYNGRKGLEMAKYANLANLYILVNVTAGTPDTATIEYFGPYNDQLLGTTGYGPNGGVYLGADYDDDGSHSPNGTAPQITVNGTAINSNIEPPELVSWVPYKVDGTGHVLQGLYDQRESKPVDLVQIDVMALNQALALVNAAILNNKDKTNAPPGSTDHTAIINLNGPNTSHPTYNIWGSGKSGITQNYEDNTAGHRNFQPTTGGWNGIIYVDIEGAPTLGTLVAVGIGNAQTTVTQDANTHPQVGYSTKVANVTSALTPAGSTPNPYGSSPVYPVIPNNPPTTPISTLPTATQYLTNIIPNNPNYKDSTTTPPTPFLDTRVGVDSFSTAGTAPIGISIATNNPVYIEGNFNADGSVNNTDPEPTGAPAWPVTGSSNLPDDETAYNSTTGVWTPRQSTAEVPVAIVGDAITFLSPTYFGGKCPSGDGSPPSEWVFPTGASTATDPNPVLNDVSSSNKKPYNNATNSNAYNSKNNAKPDAADASSNKETMEVSMACIAGIRPTDSVSASGGAHNFPRFLENWNNGSAVEIRGSLVNLYASKWATGRYNTNYYEPPHRHWGYADLFESGIFPPGTPFAWSFRRLDFKNISSQQYNTLKNAMYPGDTFVQY